ncbi:FecR family protein [Mucilaginibacter sp. SMC90]|uniref:FecR family protein n=1 Tax=Mucilaginibacter sp. SMC90 TaxID=2929803 RepID=UPI001FB27685|nr:FecR family protein [Mucilaginibacter sp. SMC90]UOE47482.1 FecR family protein [Mucilaginibacter sp. SMC90]
MSQKFNVQDLLSKYHAGTITDDERILLEEWYINWKPERQDLSHREIEQMKSKVWQSLNVDVKPAAPARLWPRIAAAASIIFCISIAGYFVVNPKHPHPQIAAKIHKQDIAPGGNKAILTLNNGLRINLNSQVNGTIAKQGNAKVVKMSNGQLAYAPEAADASSVVYNTLSTPRGGKYDLVLSDGTKVWLNSASSITYPTVFKGKNRTVNITGEVYFEIIHNAKQPFIVNFKGNTVEDIGTQFNINAYDDEPVIKTTVVEGSIKLLKDSKSVTLHPGQQSITSLSGNEIEVRDADINEATAWKNGMFKFKQAKIEEVMRQLSRWYNVDISYPFGIPKTVFSGEMIKDANASQILDMLTYFKVNYEIVQQTNGTGKKIIIKP